MRVCQLNWPLRHWICLIFYIFFTTEIHFGRIVWSSSPRPILTWWRHQMETLSALLALCAGNSPVTGEFPAQTSVTRTFDVSFDLRLKKRLSKQSWGWWFGMPSCSLWRHRNQIKSVFPWIGIPVWDKIVVMIINTLSRIPPLVLEKRYNCPSTRRANPKDIVN